MPPTDLAASRTMRSIRSTSCSAARLLPASTCAESRVISDSYFLTTSVTRAVSASTITCSSSALPPKGTVSAPNTLNIFWSNDTVDIMPCKSAVPLDISRVTFDCTCSIGINPILMKKPQINTIRQVSKVMPRIINRSVTERIFSSVAPFSLTAAGRCACGAVGCCAGGVIGCCVCAAAGCATGFPHLAQKRAPSRNSAPQ